MLSIRNFSRSALRSATRYSAQPARRTFASFYRPSALQQTSRISSLLPRRAAFSSTSTYKEAQEGQVDGELSAKLQEEYNLEEEMSVPNEMPAHLSEFLESSGFALEEKEGSQEVTLTKQFGNETIKVAFNIADIDTLDADVDPYAADNALADEGVEGGSASAAGGKNTEAAELAAEDDMNDGEAESNFPVRIDVSIQKAGTEGSIQFSGAATDGQIITENVLYFPTKEMADAKDIQSEWNRRVVYTGPPYGNLDEDLQAIMERYLDERGINTALALWLPDFVDFKEQREYLKWLQNLKAFVDA